MRPTARRQSALRAPLNDILGTEASVRLLRALALEPTPLSPSELARRTQLQLSGITKALRGLEQTGMLEVIGTGSRRPVRLREDHPLASALRALFKAERDRADGVVETLRKMAARIYPVPIAAWMEGPVAIGVDRPEDSIIVVILTETPHIEHTRDAFETLLGDAERTFDADVEFRIRTRADVAIATEEERQQLVQAIPLVGPPPASLIDRATPRTKTRRIHARSHAQVDVRSRALAEAIAHRLETDPTLVVRAQEWVAHRLDSASGGERRELREWARILRTMSPPRLRRFLVDPGERATRLRQTSPFASVLTPDEREQLLDATSTEAR
jgi:DNA-binding transcriptional ArsR family regulator